jgi:hypothetical protein
MENEEVTTVKADEIAKGTLHQDTEKKAADESEKTESGSAKESSLSFDDFLKQKGNQAEFDRRINAAVQKGISNAKEKWEAITNDKVSEAEKLAKMNAAEKTAYLQSKKEKELEAKEAEINKRELMASAKNMLADKNLPLELADMLSYKDADSCKASIEAMEKAFNKAVKDAVSERLKGGEPMKKAGEENEKDMAAEVAKALAGHI